MPWWPSRYGPEDTRGSGNELSPERLLRALKIPRRGEVIELAPPLDAAAPRWEGRTWGQTLLAHGATAEHRRRSENADTYLEELVVGGLHNGCHVDALGHSGIDGRFYNGRPLEEVFGQEGLRTLGIEQATPWITRGVRLDLPGLLGREQLEGGFVVTPTHLEEACRRQEATIEPGDAVLLHTGWGRLYRADPRRYLESEPGVGCDAARWLSDRRVSLVGADNWGFEVVPSEEGRRDQDFPVHQHLLAETGTFILENADTGALDATEFLFIASPAKIKGATAGPVNPLAVV
ncbi:MAG TPA: cyclase family protein [Solirubrobacterales bacterium]|jgi:kynurenine formamidase|nr:cyclase family protein [Solirubrobacterales bacterium]